jgi:serine/threonine protein kinase
MPIASHSCPSCAAPVGDASSICPACGEALTLPSEDATGVSDADAGRGDPPRAIAADITAGLRPAETADEIGRLGHYRVLAQLGAGGMGAVYLAEDLQLQRQVALKAMLPELAANPTARMRFLREARAIAKVEHDHIIPIFQVSEDNGTAFLAMPLLKGESLANRLRPGSPLAMSEAVRIGREVAEGLAAAHEKGLVHRDIKPANIWLEGTRRRVRILDFGLARMATDSPDGDPTLTRQGGVVGTPAYMSPEQARGEPVDRRTDLWSLGVVLYQMTTGKRPFEAQITTAALLALALDNPAPPATVNSNVPRPLSDLIMSLLNKKPDDRPASAADVVRSLTDVEVALTAIPLADSPSSIAETFAGLHEVTPVVAKLAAAPRSKRRTGVRTLILWGFLAAMVLGGGVTLIALSVRVPKGTLVIESDVPGAEIVVKKDGTPIRGRTRDRAIELQVGDYTAELADAPSGLRLLPDRFEIRRDERTVVRVRMDKSPVVGPAKPRPSMSSAYREAHGVDAAGLEKWAGQLPVGYLLTWVALRAGTNEPVFDAVAIPISEGPRWHLQLSPWKRHDQDFEERTDDGFAPIISFTYFSRRAPAGALFVWVKDDLGWGNWSGDIPYVRTKLNDERTAGHRPIYLCTNELPDGPEYELLTREHADSAAELAFDLTSAELAAAIQTHRQKEWRPESITVSRRDEKTVFQAVFVENKPKLDWEFQTGLTSSEYEKQLAAPAHAHQRPSIVCSVAADSAVVYTVVWVDATPPDKSIP